MFEHYLKENQEQKQFLSESEECKTEEDRIRFCKKYLESKGYSFGSGAAAARKYGHNMTVEEKEEMDFFDDLMVGVLQPPASITPTPRNMQILEYNERIPLYQLKELDPSNRSHLHEKMKENVAVGLARNMLKQDLIKYISHEDLYLDSKILKGIIGVVKQ